MSQSQVECDIAFEQYHTYNFFVVSKFQRIPHINVSAGKSKPVDISIQKISMYSYELLTLYIIQCTLGRNLTYLWILNQVCRFEFIKCLICKLVDLHYKLTFSVHPWKFAQVLTLIRMLLTVELVNVENILCEYLQTFLILVIIRISTIILSRDDYDYHVSW